MKLSSGSEVVEDRSKGVHTMLTHTRTKYRTRGGTQGAYSIPILDGVPGRSVEDIDCKGNGDSEDRAWTGHAGSGVR